MFKRTVPMERPTGSSDNGKERSSTDNARVRTSTTIGSTIKIKGEVQVTGNQGLHIEGSVEGTLSLRDNILSVGKEGRIKASVDARAIFVRGTVDGDLNGAEQVVIYSSGNVHGDIVAPRVTLEDGCRFKGSIDTDIEPRISHTAGTSRKKEGAARFGLTEDVSSDAAFTKEPASV